MPVLDDGVFYLTTDTGQLYVGLGGVNFVIGAPLMATVAINGNANPTRFIEPNVDGSVVVEAPAGAALSLDGVDATGVTPPAGAVGIRGWLSSIWNKLNTGSVSVSLGTAFGKTAVLKTGQLTTTAVTQVTPLTYTVTAGKTFYLEYLDFVGRLTVPSATASVLGTVIVQIGGVTVYTGTFVNPTTSDCGSQAVRLMFTEPIPIATATALAILATPAAVTSMLWTANFGGYEK
jgi:hypothetical protein